MFTLDDLNLHSVPDLQDPVLKKTKMNKPTCGPMKNAWQGKADLRGLRHKVKDSFIFPQPKSIMDGLTMQSVL